MKSGIYNSKFEFQEIDLYDVSRLCHLIVNKVIKNNIELKNVYEEYKNNITRFNPDFEFCLHELGLCLLDPLCTGKDQILFSSNKHTYLIDHNIFNKDYLPKNFNIENTDADILLDFPILTDKNVDYDKDFSNYKFYSEGIADEKGYVDAKFIHGLDNLSKVLIINKIIEDKSFYENCIYSLIKKCYPVMILTNRVNCISLKRKDNNSFLLEYVSENTGKLQEFIKYLEDNNMISNYLPINK